MDIGRLLHDFDARLKRIENSPRLSHAAIDGTAVQVRDSAGSLRALVGMQADGTTAVNVVNGPPPPQPTPPLLASVLGGVTASWDGAFAGGSTVPLDFARIEVHASTVNGFTPDTSTLAATIETPRGATVVIPTSVGVYVRLMARSTSGTASTPSTQAGPTSPSVVVAADILDGIVTTLKLADDAVTQAKVATGAIGTTEISDNAVTTEKIIAGAILAGQIAAGAVLTDKLAAEAVTAAKIAALTITSDKIAANAITVGKLAAGAVDATAIAADAITGKTITGGTITGTTVTGGTIQTATSGERVAINESNNKKIRIYNAAGTLVGDFTKDGIGWRGTNGSVLSMNANATYPQLAFFNIANTKASVIQASEDGSGNVRIEQLSNRFTSGAYTDMVWHQVIGVDQAFIERIRDDGLFATFLGGALYLYPTYAKLALNNTDDATQAAALTMEAALGHFDNARLQIFAPTSNNTVLYAEGTSTHTGNLLRLYRGADKFVVDKDGNTTVAGSITSANVDHGTVNATLSAASSVDVTVTFSKTFPTAPHVVASLVGNPTLPSNSSALITRPFNITTTGCQIRVNDVAGTARSLTHRVDWIARS